MLFGLIRDKWKYLILFLYLAILSLGIATHEPWFDEAQSWLISRDSNFFDMIINVLRYTNQSGLWNFLLIIPAKLHLPYISVNILSGIIAAVAVWLFLRYSPFPFYIKALFPFSYFILYQYAVIGRYYSLMTLFLFLIAILYRNRAKHIYIYNILLCLLASTSVHGILISIILFILQFKDIATVWTGLDSSVKKEYYKSIALYAGVLLFLTYILWIPDDISKWKVWYLNFNRFYQMSKTIFSSFYANGYLALLCVISSMILLFRKKVFLIYFLTTFLLTLLFTLKVYNLWYEGVLFLVWVFSLWLSIDALDKENKILNNIVSVLFAVVLVFQIGWSYKSMAYDFYNNYSASKDAAFYIKKNHLENKKIYAYGFISTSLLPYFDKVIFDNYKGVQKNSYWSWSDKNPIDTYIVKERSQRLIKRESPEYIIVGVRYKFMFQNFQIPNYRIIKAFEGRLFYKNKKTASESYYLFKRNN